MQNLSKPRKAKFEKFTGKNGQFYWRFKAKNGEKVAQSEGYVSSAGRDNGIRVLKEQAGDADVESVTE